MDSPTRPSKLFVEAAVRGRILASPLQARGCTDAEVLSLEQSWGKPFPRTYVDFLREVGKGLGSLFTGTDVFHPKCQEFKSVSLDMRAEGMPLPEDAVVYLDHQGYIAQYFHVDSGSDDPPVFEVTTSSSEPLLVASSFSAMMINSIEEHVWPGRPQLNLGTGDYDNKPTLRIDVNQNQGPFDDFGVPGQEKP